VAAKTMKPEKLSLHLGTKLRDATSERSEFSQQNFNKSTVSRSVIIFSVIGALIE
jgi:hypothetical protein